jgi:hypothetical protein
MMLPRDLSATSAAFSETGSEPRFGATRLLDFPLKPKPILRGYLPNGWSPNLFVFFSSAW